MGTWGAPASRSSTLTFQPAENRLAEGVVHIPDSARLGLEIAPQEVTQHSVRRNETPPIALESETCSSYIRHMRGYRRGERMFQTFHALPVTSIVGEQSARFTASASATSTSRGPSKRSLPCAVRTLSTSIRSPLCHRSRAVFSSCTSLINCMTSAPIGSPLPKRVLNGSPSSP